MYVAQNNLSINRLGISVSKKVGNSVVRHHLTRLIREAYRLNSNMFNSSLDIVVIARNTAKDKTYKEVESALLHLANHGVTILSVLNIFLVGILFSLMVYYMDSLWCAFAVHTAWNFTQNILFGLPNSGINVPYSVFKLNAATARDSFAYNVGFGIEGTVFADIVLLAACVLLYLWGRKHGKKSMDVWAET